MKKGQTKLRAAHHKKVVQAPRKEAQGAAESARKVKVRTEEREALCKRKLMEFCQDRPKRGKGELSTEAKVVTRLYVPIRTSSTRASLQSNRGSWNVFPGDDHTVAPTPATPHYRWHKPSPQRD